MKYYILLISYLLLTGNHSYSNHYTASRFVNGTSMAKNVYLEGLPADVFEIALKGYEKLRLMGKLTNIKYLTIADFSKPSNEERLFIIDVNTMQVVLKSLVAHGKNSGLQFAKHFSNKVSSYQSSLGFYITGNLYSGKHGNSLQLNGVEHGINDLAMDRAIVIHGANYVSNDFIAKQGFIGRSQGCPAVPNEKVNNIIQTIQGASCLFIYAPDKFYTAHSSLIR